MAYFDITTSQTVDAFLASNPTYQNTPWTRDTIFVSEGATLTQTNAESIETLYAVDLVLGENSEGTAIVKTGFVHFTKVGFTLILTHATAPVQPDSLSPLPMNISVVTAWQDITGTLLGRTVVTLNWNIPEYDEIVNDKFMATGSLQTISTSFAPVKLESEIVYEVTGYPPSGGDSVLAFSFLEDQDILRVADPTGFLTGQMVEIDDLSGHVWFYRILSVDGQDIQLNTRSNFQGGFPQGSTVKTVSAVAKTRNVDYTFDNMMGQINLLNGRFTNGNPVVFIYQPILIDLSHYSVFRVPGDHPVKTKMGYTKITRDDVTNFPGHKLLTNNLVGAATSYSEITLPIENGTTWTYYLFAHDNKAPSNISWATSIMVELIPSIPQGIEASVGDGQVFLNWAQVPVSSDINTNGFNIYRCEGPTFIPAESYRLNSMLIPRHTPYFSDSRFNDYNRRHWTVVPTPKNGVQYSYRLESEDSDTSWDIGTKNEDAETGASVLTAVKNG